LVIAMAKPSNVQIAGAWLKFGNFKAKFKESNY